MELQFYGANCIAVSTKNARVCVDDNLAELGVKSAAKTNDVALFTGAHADPAQPTKMLVDHPGEYEMAGISIYGIAVRGHMDEASKKTATMYKIIADDFRILVVGHIYPELNDKQLEAIGMIDVMVVPVGGHGYTLDATGALSLIKKIEPKIVIPTHYDDASLKFPVPQAPLDDALKVLAMEARERVARLKLKPSDLGLGENTQLIVLERAA